ncbi:MAG: hypothetical protein ACRESJ_11870, partial [Pseudomonas sp.]|uniref:hypothetical protein n=1 Tax=Pseudomonas sp. TaxID=306 RepID=UPI003D6E13C6
LRARRLKNREGYVTLQTPASSAYRPLQSSSIDAMGCPRATHCIGLRDCLPAPDASRLEETENGLE